MFVRWRSTVFSLITSASAISLVLQLDDLGLPRRERVLADRGIVARAVEQVADQRRHRAWV